MNQWSIAQFDKEKAKTISEIYNLPSIIAILLTIRGITTENEIRDFLFNDSELSDPFLIEDMDKAVKRILFSVENGEKICIYGDYDADGVSSTALLYSYLETVGADVTYYIPKRESEGYGMNCEAISALHSQGVKLIITVDNGISAVEEIALGNSLGIDTVVTDHHMPDEELPDAVAILDVHRESAHKGFKYMSGVGIAFMLIIALEGEYADIDMLLDNYSDIVSIGTVGDRVPLVHDNRVFVKRGINAIENGDRIGIQALVSESGLRERRVNSYNMSFTIVPRINAVGRLGLSATSVDLLLSENPESARETALKLNEDNSERQRIEREILSKINELIARNPSLVQDRVIVIDGEGWHQGVIGIVAARIKDIYGKPCIIISQVDDICRGSGRSVEGFDLWKAVSACSDLLDQFGGHPMAAGLEIPRDNIPTFRKIINSYAAQIGEIPYNILNIDCKLNPAFLDIELARQLDYMQPFGAGNPEPVFMISGVTVASVVPMSGDKHIRINFKSSRGNFSAVKFFCSSADFPYSRGESVDIAVTPEVNSYRGEESLTIRIRDIKLSGVDNSKYIDSLRIFEHFCRGENLTAAEIASITPDRNDFATVYRYLRRDKSTSVVPSVMISKLDGDISYGKLKVILEAMNELGLIALYEDMYRTELRLLEVSGKVNLDDAVIIKKLKGGLRREQV